MTHTKDEEILALKTALKALEFSAEGNCCPSCGGYKCHFYCVLNGLLRPEAAEAYMENTGMTPIYALVRTAKLDPKYSALLQSNGGEEC